MNYEDAAGILSQLEEPTAAQVLAPTEYDEAATFVSHGNLAGRHGVFRDGVRRCWLHAART